MNILAIETSGQAGSVAVLNDGRFLREILLLPTQKSASTLAPAVRDILAEVGWKNTDVHVIAVAIGPGSFTGLRVGATTAKALAYALSAELIGVGTLDVIAAQSGVSGQVSVAMNAQREQVFACEFKSGAEGYRPLLHRRSSTTTCGSPASKQVWRSPDQRSKSWALESRPT